MSKKITEMIRVNHAGEQAAFDIYFIQNKFNKKNDIIKHLQDSLDEEVEHLKYFETEARKRKIRPTALSPIWKIGAYCIGGVSAMLGSRAIMAATEAVEDVIIDHYQEQIDELQKNNPEEKELLDKIIQFKNEEEKHKNEAVEMGSRQMKGYNFFYKTIKFVTKKAIKIATKI